MTGSKLVGKREQGTGNREQKDNVCRERGTGNREQKDNVCREWGTGNGEQKDNVCRERGTGNGEQKDKQQATIYRQDRKLLRDRATAGLQVLQNFPLTDNKRLAAIGYCFGGGTVLELARSGANIAGVVSFHGNLDTPNPNDAKNIKSKVLILHGADDPFVPEEQVKAFETEMRQANVDWQFISYGGAVHAFTNPEAKNDPKGALYNPNADKRSWQAMRQFFAEIFRKQNVNK